MLTNVFLQSILGFRSPGVPEFKDIVEYDKEAKGDILFENSSYLIGILFPNDAAMQLTNMFERDLLFANALKSAPGDKIVGIFGLSHIHGIIKCWDQHFDISKLHTKDQGIVESATLFEKLYSDVDKNH
jgi:hypothetical protein